MGLPSGPVLKNLPSNAGGMGTIPGQGTKIPHAMGQPLSPCTKLGRLHVTSRDACAPQGKILHAAVKMLQATTKT